MQQMQTLVPLNVLLLQTEVKSLINLPIEPFFAAHCMLDRLIIIG